jgi:hypothetical protein
MCENRNLIYNPNRSTPPTTTNVAATKIPQVGRLNPAGTTVGSGVAGLTVLTGFEVAGCVVVGVVVAVRVGVGVGHQPPSGGKTSQG